MNDPAVFAGAALAVALVLMIAEAVHAARNERALLARGAVEPPGDVYKTMRWAYPACFVAMAVESAFTGPPARPAIAAGIVLFAVAKLLKYWAISTLGDRWTFRVMVLPAAPLIVAGPYSYLRHPNYLAVVGELAGFAMGVAAPMSGMTAILGFGWLMLRRIAVEDRALGRKE